MRILLLNQVFYPDVAATAQHAHDLGRHLVAHGHEVVVIASRSIYGEKGATLSKREIVDGIEVHRVGKSFFGKAGLMGRLFDFVFFYLAAMFKAMTIKRCDVVVCFTTPPFIGSLGWLLKTFRRWKYVYWAMDLYPDVLIAGGMLKRGSVAARLLERFNRFCLRSADRVVVLGRCMRDLVSSKAIDPHKIVHIGVWSDHDEVQPISREENPYRQQWNALDAFIVMYSGNFGLVHDVETMCRAALQLRDDSRIRFAFVGGGKRKAEVEAFVAQHNLNALVAPYQPREKLDALLSCADAHLISLKNGYEGIVVPSKLFGVMAAGRPALFVGPKRSEIALVLEQHECGMTIEPGDVASLVKQIQLLAGEHAACRAMGDRARLALQQQYDRGHACEAWRRLLEQLLPTATPHKPVTINEPRASTAGDSA